MDVAKQKIGIFRIRSTGMKILGGALLFLLISQESVISMLAPVRELAQTIHIYSPDIQEELAHELALKEAELSSRAQMLPQIRTSFQEYFVQSSTDSGFLSNARVEVPLFQKAKPYYAWKIAKIERRSYKTTRIKNQIERIFRFRTANYEAQSCHKKLPKLLVERDLLSKLMERQSGMVIDKVKSLDQMDDVYRRWVLLDQTIQNTKAKLAVLDEEIAYLANSGSQISLASGIPDPSRPLSENEFETQKEEALIRHPDIATLQMEIEKQSAKLGLVKADRLPEISAVSIYGRDPRFVGNEDQIFGGIEVRWNIWDFGANRHEIRKENSLLREMQVKLENQKQKIALKMDEAFRFYQAAYSIWRNAQSYLEFQNERLKSSERQYHQGQISWNEFTLSQIHYLDQTVAFEEAKADALTKAAQLDFVFGLNDFSQKELNI